MRVVVTSGAQKSGPKRCLACHGLGICRRLSIGVERGLREVDCVSFAGLGHALAWIPGPRGHVQALMQVLQSGSSKQDVMTAMAGPVRVLKHRDDKERCKEDEEWGEEANSPSDLCRPGSAQKGQQCGWWTGGWVLGVAFMLFDLAACRAL